MAGSSSDAGPGRYNLRPRGRRGAGGWGVVVDAHADSPLLGPLLDDTGELFEAEVLKKWLNPTDIAMLARVGPSQRLVSAVSTLETITR